MKDRDQLPAGGRHRRPVSPEFRWGPWVLLGLLVLLLGAGVTGLLLLADWLMENTEMVG